jgi:hypothetical protein
MLSPRQLHSFTTRGDGSCHVPLNPHDLVIFSTSQDQPRLPDMLSPPGAHVAPFLGTKPCPWLSPPRPVLFLFLSFFFIELRPDTATPTLTQVPLSAMAFKNLRREIRDFRQEKKVSGHSWPTHCLQTTIVWVLTRDTAASRGATCTYFGAC